MPGWHKATQELREKDELVVLGVVQEQHAERAQLYAQWRQFDWPILQDQMNSIGIAVVPVAVLIDEFGIVQKTRFRANKIKELVAENREAPESPAPKITDEYSAASSENSVSGYIRSGDEKMKTRAFSAAITSYEQALSKSKSSDDKSIKRLIPAINFRLGVAYRAQFDGTESNDPDDFATASKHWTAALNGNPNQYIWRRRIEQYGPRNIKPYPFYDWVEQATAEIKARGEDPIELQVALSGAEIAQPSKQKLAKSDVKLKNPDPDAAITKVDLQSPMIKYSSIVVPDQIKPGQTVRVHLTFTNGDGSKWNNESSPLQVWINEANGGIVSQQLFEIDNPKEPSSDESRTIEFEFQTNENARTPELTGFVLANVCKDDDGQCLYRRCDFTIKIPIVK